MFPTNNFKQEINTNNIFNFNTIKQKKIELNNNPYKLNNKNFSIGLFVNNMNRQYELNTFYGIKDFAKKHNINLLCFIGSEIETPIHSKSNKNMVFDLASNYNLDGIIGISTSISSYITKDKLVDFYNKYISIPIVSIGIDINGLSTISIDNEKAFRELLIHLINVHKYKKLAFIKGPENNFDCNLRFNIYKEVLEEYNIKFNRKLIVNGNFLKNSGKEAVKILIDERKENIDVIIGINDYLAIDAAEELLKRGFKIPEDIAIVGFDNITESRYFKPKITTINQPVYNLGYEALNMLNDKLNNKENENNSKKILLSELIIRESCGCKKNHIVNNDHKIVLKKKILFKTDFNKIKMDLELNISNLMYKKFFIFNNKEKIKEWTITVLDSIIKSIFKINKNITIKILEEVIVESTTFNIDIDSWKDIFSFIFENIIINLVYEKQKLLLIELLFKVNGLLNNIEINLKNSFMNSNINQSSYLFEITNEFLNIIKLENLNKVLINELPKFGIKSCYLSVFDKKETNTSKNYSNLLFAYEDYKIINTNNIKYLTKELLPGGFKTQKGNIYIIINLYCMYEQLGFIIFEIEHKLENTHIEIFENFAIQISNVINRINIYNKKIDNKTSQDFFNNKSELEISKYKKSRLSKKKSKKYFEILLDFMKKDKLYLNPDLNVKILSEKTKITNFRISYIINEYLGFTFYDFINTYRIKEVIKRLSNEESAKNNILDIAYDSGFRSKSTFYKMFKKYTSVTPTEYIQKKH